MFTASPESLVSLCPEGDADNVATSCQLVVDGRQAVPQRLHAGSMWLRCIALALFALPAFGEQNVNDRWATRRAKLSQRPTYVAADPLKREESMRLPEARLRGYGGLSGHFRSYADGASRLIITAEDTGRARIVAAKCWSDLQLLGGVSADAIAGLPVMRAQGQGWIGVVQRGRRVAILASRSRGLLAALREKTRWEAADTSAEVPMLLDAWDKYGFRFYYRPYELPNRETTWADYSVLDEFDFAKRLGRLGFVFWASPADVDTGIGLTNNVWWDWAARAAARRKLPVVINTMSAAPTWLLDRYRDQVQQKMPQYCGSFHSIAEPHHDGRRQLSWCATTAKDEQLSMLQGIVQEYASQPNVIDFLEPHGELDHGEYRIFLEYGPAADRSYQHFLRGKYRSLRKLNRRWFGEKRLSDWSEVRVPEVASFVGCNERAFDLTGEWRIGYEEFAEGTALQPHQLRGMHNDDIPTKPVPDEWYAPDFDDSTWPSLRAPGNDRMMFLPKRPAVFRRRFELDGWLVEGQRAWLVVWDLNLGKHVKSTMRAVLNGHEVGRDTLQHATPHWAAFEVTDALRPGANVLALRLPKGVLAYRTYLTQSPPRQYPALGEHLNAQWVDFADWQRWSRLEMVRRGMEMIRQADPDRSIICMSPDRYFSGIKRLCEEYGGRFHNTGHMGGFWNDYLPMLMRGSDLPFSLEPGGPARSLESFKNMMGLYFTEGIQAIHYFIHVGNIFWPDDIRRHFEDIQPLVHTIGKVHPPKAKAAMLLSNRISNLTRYPWRKNYNVNLRSGYWGWRFSDALADHYHIDGLTELDFESGNADPYRVIVDTNSSVMDESLIDGIDQWVKRGGIFVTAIQSGRHTPERPDSWPISRLTGYRVTGIDPHRPDGGEGRTRRFTFVEGQPIFAPEDFRVDKNHYANGLSLERVSDDCRDLIRWEDGPVAAGLRKLGRGYVVHLGIKFGNGRGGGGGNYLKIFRRVLEWAEVPALGARAEGVILRHYVSNNGLFDVWTLWNRDPKKPVRTRLEFDVEPPRCTDVKTRAEIDPARLTFAPLETKILLTPRNRIETAPLDWFRLQRNWWRGTKRPSRTSLRKPDTTNILDLTDSWACKPLSEEAKDDPAPLADPSLDDSAWPRRRLGYWAVPEELPSRHVFFRRRFKVPQQWQRGEMTLWLRSWFSSFVDGRARYWLDGKELPAGDGRYGIIKELSLAPGSEHTLAIEVRGSGQVTGMRGNAWLHFRPADKAKLNLAGSWIPTRDMLRDESPVRVPGKYQGLAAIRRKVRIPSDWQGQIYLYFKGTYALTGAIINGLYIRKHHHALGEATHLNITSLLKDGENEIEILLSGKSELWEVELRLY